MTEPKEKDLAEQLAVLWIGFDAAVKQAMMGKLLITSHNGRGKGCSSRKDFE